MIKHVPRLPLDRESFVRERVSFGKTAIGGMTETSRRPPPGVGHQTESRNVVDVPLTHAPSRNPSIAAPERFQHLSCKVIRIPRDARPRCNFRVEDARTPSKFYSKGKVAL